MNLFELFVKITAKDEVSEKVKGLKSLIGGGLSTAAKAGVAAVGAVASGITALVGASIKAQGEYKQLAGGAKKIFDEIDFKKIKADADEAFKTLGLSANQYLSAINDVGATLAATMGDTKGYETAKTGLKAISDYATGTGKSVDLLSQKYMMISRSAGSYQSIADQFSGVLPQTSADFLEQAQAAGFLSGSYKKLTAVPVAEYQEAVTKMLEKGVSALGLTGNTAAEAFGTMTGSIGMAKAAWDNLVVGLSDDSADLPGLIDKFVQSASAVGENIIPKISTALNGIATLIKQVVPKAAAEIPTLISENLPVLISAAILVLEALVQGISDNKEILITSAFDIIGQLANSILTLSPQILTIGFDVLMSLISGITTNLSQIIPAAIDIVVKIADTVTNPSTLTNILDAALALILALSDGLIDAIPQLVGAAITIITNICDFLYSPENLSKILTVALQLIIALGTGIINSIPQLVQFVIQIPTSIKDTILSTDWKSIGSNIVNGVWSGLKSSWSSMKKWFDNAWSNLVGGTKNLLGIHSPSTVFAGIGKNMVLGLEEGWDKEFLNAQKTIDGSLSFESGYGSFSPSSSRNQTTGNVYNINVNVDNVPDKQTARYFAEQISEKIAALKQDNDRAKGEWSLA